jgi:hypothetical protein
VVDITFIFCSGSNWNVFKFWAPSVQLAECINQKSLQFPFSLTWVVLGNLLSTSWSDSSRFFLNFEFIIRNAFGGTWQIIKNFKILTTFFNQLAHIRISHGLKPCCAQKIPCSTGFWTRGYSQYKDV